MCVKTDENQRFSYFAGFAARERMREAKPVKLKKVAFSHFFDTLKAAFAAFPFYQPLQTVSYSNCRSYTSMIVSRFTSALSRNCASVITLVIVGRPVVRY